ncbi:MAG: hypothetical protein QW548_03490 [Candidatus Aenigmatarchaeota archaeon]
MPYKPAIRAGRPEGCRRCPYFVDETRCMDRPEGEMWLSACQNPQVVEHYKGKSVLHFLGDNQSHIVTTQQMIAVCRQKGLYKSEARN